MSRLDHLAPLVLRLGLASVFAWFGLHQLLDPASWTVFVPAFMRSLLLSPETIILLNGWTEVVGASLLLIGCLTRPVAFMLALHTLLIAIEIGGAIGVRDFGLAVACLALALSSPDSWSTDARLGAPKQSPKQV